MLVDNEPAPAVDVDPFAWDEEDDEVCFNSFYFIFILKNFLKRMMQLKKLLMPLVVMKQLCAKK